MTRWDKHVPEATHKYTGPRRENAPPPKRDKHMAPKKGQMDIPVLNTDDKGTIVGKGPSGSKLFKTTKGDRFAVGAHELERL